MDIVDGLEVVDVHHNNRQVSGCCLAGKKFVKLGFCRRVIEQSGQAISLSRAQHGSIAFNLGLDDGA